MARTERNDSATTPGSAGEETHAPGGGLGSTVALFVLLAAFWLLLSGRIGLQYFIFLSGSVGLVLWMNPERPFRQADPSRGMGLSGRLKALVAFVRYLVWLVWNVMKANVEVAIMILHPRLPIRPALFRFRTTLKDDVAKVLVANSITLTPGTVTIDLEDDTYLVHAIHPRSVSAVESGALQNMVAPIFGESADPVPELQWGASMEEFET
jgi:multicomponent Na+:H+ antiporter subunit E